MLWLLAAAWYTLASFCSLILYGLDKSRARREAKRIPETRLHLVDALGGWPGGLLARNVFRHKTRKGTFLSISWIIILLHAIAWAVGLYVATVR